MVYSLVPSFLHVQCHGSIGIGLTCILCVKGFVVEMFCTHLYDIVHNCALNECSSSTRLIVVLNHSVSI